MPELKLNSLFAQQALQEGPPQAANSTRVYGRFVLDPAIPAFSSLGARRDISRIGIYPNFRAATQIPLQHFWPGNGRAAEP
ncbi:hypothetical protein AWB80_06250 [Caballeronia pedi]|uniref:Uncharacterized protein n=1 Tax=Caballeronia pedi TaxID=1777141 RepID=A0A158D5X0_9BURK|nr:hypothetical protein AWB80_06250 [Caballeronia pedi]